MARFSVILSIAVVGVVALYTNQALADVVAVTGSDAPTCYRPDSTDCLGKLPNCKATPCCSDLKYGVADDGSTFAIGYGTCTCCTANKCKYEYSGANATNPETGANARAFNQKCALLAV